MFSSYSSPTTGQNPWDTAQGGQVPGQAPGQAPGASPWAATIDPNNPIGRQGSILNAATGGAPAQNSVLGLLGNAAGQITGQPTGGVAGQPGSVFSGLSNMFGAGAPAQGAAPAPGGPGAPQSVQGGTAPGLPLPAGMAAPGTPSPMATPSPMVQGAPVGLQQNTGGGNFSQIGGNGDATSTAIDKFGPAWQNGYANRNPFMAGQS